MRCVFALLCLLSSGCSSESTAELAKPVTAPMTTRDRLLHDLEQQKAKARERSDHFDRATAPR